MEYEAIKTTFANAHKLAKETGRTVASFLEVIALKDEGKFSPNEIYTGTGTIIAHPGIGANTPERIFFREGKQSNVFPVPVNLVRLVDFGFLLEPDSYEYKREEGSNLFLPSPEIPHDAGEYLQLTNFGDLCFYVWNSWNQPEVSKRAEAMKSVNRLRGQPYVGPLLLGGDNLERAVTIMNPFAEYQYLLLGESTKKGETKITPVAKEPEKVYYASGTKAQIVKALHDVMIHKGFFWGPADFKVPTDTIEKLLEKFGDDETINYPSEEMYYEIMKKINPQCYNDLFRVRLKKLKELLNSPQLPKKQKEPKKKR